MAIAFPNDRPRPSWMRRSPRSCGSSGVGREWRTLTWEQEISLEYGKALRGRETTPGPFRVFGANGPIGLTSQPLALAGLQATGLGRGGNISANLGGSRTPHVRLPARRPGRHGGSLLARNSAGRRDRG